MALKGTRKGWRQRKYVEQLRIHTAREQDDRQREHTDELCILVTVELQPQAVAAEEHAREEKQQQRRYPETVAPFADNNAGEDEHRADKKDILWCKRHLGFAFSIRRPVL